MTEKIIRYSYCCDARKELFERHIRPDCKDCNRNRHYGEYKIEGLRMPCSEHIISDIFESDCPIVCEHVCFIRDALRISDGNLKNVLKRGRCSQCNIVKVEKGEYPNVMTCVLDGKRFCNECLKYNMLLMSNGEPETYKCFNCVPEEKLEAIRLNQI